MVSGICLVKVMTSDSFEMETYPEVRSICISQPHMANRNTEPISRRKKICQRKEFAKNSVACKGEGCWKDKKQFEQVKVGKTYVALSSACWDLSVSSFMFFFHD